MGETTSEGRPALQAPPRAVPPGLARRLMFTGGKVRLGWFLLLVSAIALAIIGPRVDIDLATYARQADGALTAVERTGMKPSKRSKERLWELRYTFRDPAGATRTGTSYLYALDATPPYGIGDAVRVEYVDGEPGRSRVVGARRGMLPPFLLLAVIGPLLIGLRLVARGIRTGARRVRLLRLGIEVPGTLVETPAAARKQGVKPVVTLTFAFRVAPDAPERRVTIHTDNPRALEDDATERVLVDSEFPDRVTLLDGLPGPITVAPDGTLVGPPGTALAALVQPVLVGVAWVVALILVVAR